MVTFNITLSTGKIQEYIGDYVFVNKNTEMKDNPNYVSPTIINGEGLTIPNPDYAGEPRQILIYTDAQWVKEHILRNIRSQIIAGKEAQARIIQYDEVENNVT